MKELAALDIDKAYELNPKDTEVLLTKINLAMIAEEYDVARTVLEKSLVVAPTDHRFYSLFATLEVREKDLDAAFEHLDNGIAKVKQPVDLLFRKAQFYISKNDGTAIRKIKNTLSTYKLRPEFLDYMEGQALFAEGRWLEAAEQYKEIRSSFATNPQLGPQLDSFLGQCYDKLGMPDLALASYSNAYSANPEDRFSKARMDTLQARLLPGKRNSGSNLDSLIAIERAKPLEERDWTQVDALTNKSIELNKPDQSTEWLFKAGILSKQEKHKQARELVRKALQSDSSDSLRVWLLAAQLTQDDPDKGPGPALKILDRALEKFPESEPLIRARKSTLILALGGEDVSKNLMVLTEGIEEWTKPQQIQVWSAVSGAFLRLRMLDDAKVCWENILELDPQDLATRVEMFSQARMRTDNPAMQSAQEEILKVVKKKTHVTYQYTEAARIVTLFGAGRSDQSELTRAEKLIEDAILDRPDWHKLYEMQAQIALIQGNPIKALASLDHAASLGPHSHYPFETTRPPIAASWQSYGSKKSYRNTVQAIAHTFLR